MLPWEGAAVFDNISHELPLRAVSGEAGAVYSLELLASHPYRHSGLRGPSKPRTEEGRFWQVRGQLHPEMVRRCRLTRHCQCLLQELGLRFP